MTWDEPSVVARRLATRLGTSVTRPPVTGGAGEVLVLSAAQLDEIADERLSTAAATLVVGEPEAATSAGLTALRGTVEAREAVAVVLTTFATVALEGSCQDVPLAIAAPAGDSQIAELVAAGPHGLTLDGAVAFDELPEAAGPARVCIVSFEISGMTGGGIGTASTSLAETLAREGHDVTFLFTGWQEVADAERNGEWQRHYAERGVRLEFLRGPAARTVKSPYFPVRSAYEVYCWLRREQPFDVVHLPENMGHGAYAQSAKAHGAAFANTTFVIGTHGPTRWAAEANRVALTREEFLVNEALERISVERADVLLGPSRYLHDYMRANEWKLPARVHVQPYAAPTAVRERPSPVAASATPLPDEIVFFGRLETRKGVVTLCDALDLLRDEDVPLTFAVTFLGPVAQVLGQPADAYIADRARTWPWRWQIVSDRDQQGAAEYLARPGVLAVMPSTVDNAPNTVSEAVALGIPLVAGRTGGTGELIAAEQRDDHMFGDSDDVPLLPLSLADVVSPPTAAPLTELLRRRLMAPVAAARAPIASAAVDAAYDRWHRAVAHTNRTAAPATVHAELSLPSLAVCVTFDGDEELLAAQLDALAGSEVVLADLRTDADDAIAVVDGRISAIVRPDRPGHVGAARTAAIAATGAELIAFVPPGDVPLPPFAQILREVAAVANADVLACAVLDELDDADADAAPREDPAVHAFVPLPGAPSAGLTHPAFAVGPFAITRAAIARLGGFAADAYGDEADHELLNRAAVAGMRIEIVPEPLAAKHRRDRWTTFRTLWPHDVAEPPYEAEQWLRVERPFAGAAAESLNVVELLRGARVETAARQDQLLEQADVHEERAAEARRWIDNLETTASEYRAYQAELEGEVTRLQQELARQRALNDEMAQSAAQLTVRTLRNAGKRVQRRVKR